MATSLVLVALLGAVDVTAFAVCDGLDDDQAGLEDAIATGQDLWFPPGVTCQASGELLLVTSQGAYGYGATLRRHPAAGETRMLQLAGRNVVAGLLFDGNRAAVGTGTWQTTAEITTLGPGSHILDVEIAECPGEAIMAYGDRQVVDHVWVHDCNGNGAHFSGGSGQVVRDSRFSYVNQDLAVGHQEGAVAWSSLVVDPLLTGLHIDHALAGFGNLTVATSSRALLLGNVVEDCGYCFEGISAAGAYTFDVQVLGNKCIRSNATINETTAGQSPKPGRWLVSGNLFDGANLTVTRARGVVVANNVFYQASPLLSSLVLASTDDTVVDGNLFDGGLYGLRATNADNTSDGILVDSNIFRRQSLATKFVASPTPLHLFLGDNVEVFP